MPAQRINLSRVPRKPDDLPPDSTFRYGPCSRCGRQSSFTVLGQAPLTYDGGHAILPDGREAATWHEQVSILQCQGCGQNMIAVEDQFVGGQKVQPGRRMGSGAEEWVGKFWWPAPGAGQLVDAPSDVADLMAEGARCLIARCPRAAVVMYRGALAAMVAGLAGDSSKSQGSLAKQLRQLAQDGTLTPSLAEWADAIRLLGNAGAHPNELEPVSQSEAEELSRLSSSVIEYLYVVPARVRRAREGRP